MNSTDPNPFRKPAVVFFKAFALIVAVAIALGLGVSFFIKAEPDQLRTFVSKTQHISESSTQKGSHEKPATQENDSSLELLKWGGTSLLCGAAFFGIAHRIYSTFGVKENES